MALIIAFGFNFFAYFFSDKMALRISRARPVTETEQPELYAIVRRLTTQIDMPTPSIYVIDSPQPNAFATGRSPKKAAVAVTTGILEVLDYSELEGGSRSRIGPRQEPGHSHQLHRCDAWRSHSNNRPDGVVQWRWQSQQPVGPDRSHRFPHRGAARRDVDPVCNLENEGVPRRRDGGGNHRPASSVGQRPREDCCWYVEDSDECEPGHQPAVHRQPAQGRQGQGSKSSLQDSSAHRGAHRASYQHGDGDQLVGARSHWALFRALAKIPTSRPCVCGARFRCAPGCPSGQRKQTVNLPAYAYGGSNPSPGTDVGVIQSSPVSSVGRAFPW